MRDESDYDKNKRMRILNWWHWKPATPGGAELIPGWDTSSKPLDNHIYSLKFLQVSLKCILLKYKVFSKFILPPL